MKYRRLNPESLPIFSFYIALLTSSNILKATTCNMITINKFIEFPLAFFNTPTLYVFASILAAKKPFA